MSSLLAIVLANAAYAAVLAVPAFVVSRYSRRSALAHALWLLVLLRLVCPPMLRPSLPWLPAEETPAAAPAPQPSQLSTWAEEPISLAEPEPRFTSTSLSAPVSGPTGSPSSPPPTTTSAQPSEERQSPLPSREAPASAAVGADPEEFLVFLGLVWLVGAVVCYGRMAFYALRFQRLLVHTQPAPSELQEQANDLARQMGMRAAPQVWLLPGALPPLVWGIGRVRIFFPEGLLNRLNRDERASLLAHELGHVARRDHQVRWLELLVAGLYWWYPLAWWARQQLQQREEECCDARAAALVPPRVYASAILEAVDFLSESRSRVPAVASPLTGVQSLKQRLTLIMTGRPQRSLAAPTRLALLALFVAALSMLPTLAREDKKSETQEAKPLDKIGNVAVVEPAEFDAVPLSLVGGIDETYSVGFSWDGKSIAAGSGNFNRPGEIEIYDVLSRKRTWHERAPRGVASLFFAFDRKRLGWAGWGGFASVADLTTHKTLFSLPVTGNNRIAFSPDGNLLATAEESGSAVRLWDAATGRAGNVFQTNLPNLYGITFSHDSRLVATAGGRFTPGGPNQAMIFDVKTGKTVAKLEGHTRVVLNVAFAPADAAIATAGGDNTVRIWDSKSYKLLRVLTGHTNMIQGLAFSSDGKTLATGSFDKSIRLWDWPTGKQLGQLNGHPGKVREVAFSPDGKMLVSCGENRSIKLWDVQNRKELATLRQDKEVQVGEGPAAAQPLSPIAIAVSPDGKTVAAGSDSGTIFVLDAATGDVVRTVMGHKDAVTVLAFSRDGKRLASSGPEAEIKLWDTTAWKELRTLKGHETWVYALLFTRDGKRLISAGYDRTIRVWDLDKPRAEPKTLPKGHTASVRALAMSPDEQLLASGSSDKMVIIWDLKTITKKETLKGHNGTVRGVAFSPDGRTLASVGEDGFLRLWDGRTFKERANLKAHPTEALSCAFSPGGRVLVTGAKGGAIHFCDPETGVKQTERNGAHREGVEQLVFGPGGRSLFSLGGSRTLKRWTGLVSPVRSFQGHTGPVTQAMPSADGKYVLSCGGWPNGDKTVRLWDMATGKEIRQFIGNKDVQVQAAAFSPDGKTLVSGGENGVIWHWEITGKLLGEFKGHTEAVAHLTFSRDGQKLLSSSNDKTLRLWNVATRTIEKTFSGHTDWVRRGVFLPDGKSILSGGRDKKMRLWDIEAEKQLKEIDNTQWVETLAVTSDGKRVLTSCNTSMKLWDLETGKELREYPAHRYGVTCVALTRDDCTALSSSYDGTICCWDVASGREIQRYRGHRDWVWSVALTPDGKRFLSSGGGGQKGDAWIAGSDFTIRLWQLPNSVLAQKR